MSLLYLAKVVAEVEVELEVEVAVEAELEIELKIDVEAEVEVETGRAQAARTMSGRAPMSGRRLCLGGATGKRVLSVYVFCCRVVC